MSDNALTVISDVPNVPTLLEFVVMLPDVFSVSTPTRLDSVTDPEFMVVLASYALVAEKFSGLWFTSKVAELRL